MKRNTSGGGIRRRFLQKVHSFSSSWSWQQRHTSLTVVLQMILSDVQFRRINQRNYEFISWISCKPRKLVCTIFVLMVTSHLSGLNDAWRLLGGQLLYLKKFDWRGVEEGKEVETDKYRYTFDLPLNGYYHLSVLNLITHVSLLHIPPPPGHPGQCTHCAVGYVNTAILCSATSGGEWWWRYSDLVIYARGKYLIHIHSNMWLALRRRLCSLCSNWYTAYAFL